MGGLSSIHFWDLKKLRLQSLLQTTQMYQVCHTIDIDIGETITDFPIAVLSSDHPVNKVGILTSLVHHIELKAYRLRHCPLLHGHVYMECIVVTTLAVHIVCLYNCIVNKIVI